MQLYKIIQIPTHSFYLDSSMLKSCIAVAQCHKQDSKTLSRISVCVCVCTRALGL